ncbi:unnamed protein product, partial [Mesorhabditis belari]|uniref:F-box domain-containing protein n=1 Tax=Mesorhabditis belari TaxID=2138241 RepID=A0AAF3FKS2_9BILA
MDSLPEELIKKIFDFCDFYSLLQMRQVNIRLNFYVNNHLWRRKELFLGTDYIQENPDLTNEMNETTLKIEKVVEFLGNFMPKLKTLSLSKAPCKISLTTVCQLSSSVLNLEELEISCNNGYPIVEPDALRGLVMFKELRILSAKDWQPKMIVRRGGCHRQDGLPLIVELETLTLSSLRDDVVKVLSQMKTEGVTMPKLKQVMLYDGLSSPQMPSILSWFIEKHQTLRKIVLQKVLFTTISELETFLLVIVQHNHLEEVTLKECN